MTKQRHRVANITQDLVGTWMPSMLPPDLASSEHLGALELHLILGAGALCSEWTGDSGTFFLWTLMAAINLPTHLLKLVPSPGSMSEHPVRDAIAMTIQLSKGTTDTELAGSTCLSFIDNFNYLFRVSDSEKAQFHLKHVK